MPIGMSNPNRMVFETDDLNGRPIVFVGGCREKARRMVLAAIESLGLFPQFFESIQECLLASARPSGIGCTVLDGDTLEDGDLQIMYHFASDAFNIPVVVVATQADLQAATAVMKAGAFDFVNEPWGDGVLQRSVEQAIAEDRRRRPRRQQRTAIQRRLARLTPREREVMDLVVSGKTSKEIAFRLGVSARTIDVHRERIMLKMEADGIVALVRMALMFRPDSGWPSLLPGRLHRQ